MARSRDGFVCHKHRSLVSYERHHVWPLGYHGPDTAANKVKICPNAHSDIHYLMELILRGKPYDLTEYGPAVRELALRGAREVTAYADSLAALYASNRLTRLSTSSDQSVPSMTQSCSS
jgi:hypothetical protein